MDEATLLGQANVFKIFIRDCLHHPELRRSSALEKFLLIANYDDFTEQKKNLDGLLANKKDIRVAVTKKALETDNLPEFPLESFKTLSGTVNCDLMIG